MPQLGTYNVTTDEREAQSINFPAPSDEDVAYGAASSTRPISLAYQAYQNYQNSPDVLGIPRTPVQKPAMPVRGAYTPDPVVVSSPVNSIDNTQFDDDTQALRESGLYSEVQNHPLNILVSQTPPTRAQQFQNVANQKIFNANRGGMDIPANTGMDNPNGAGDAQYDGWNLTDNNGQRTYRGQYGFVTVNNNKQAPAYGRVTLGKPSSGGESVSMVPNTSANQPVDTQNNFDKIKLLSNGAFVDENGQQVVKSPEFIAAYHQNVSDKLNDVKRTLFNPEATKEDNDNALKQYPILREQIQNAEGALSVAQGVPGSINGQNRVMTSAEDAQRLGQATGANMGQHNAQTNQQFQQAANGIQSPDGTWNGLTPQQQSQLQTQGLAQNTAFANYATGAPGQPLGAQMQRTQALQYGNDQGPMRDMVSGRMSAPSALSRAGQMAPGQQSGYSTQNDPQILQLQSALQDHEQRIAQGMQVANTATDPAIQRGAQMHVQGLQDNHALIQNMIVNRMMQLANQAAGRRTPMANSYGEMQGITAANQLQNQNLGVQEGVLGRVGTLNEAYLGKQVQQERYGNQLGRYADTLSFQRQREEDNANYKARMAITAEERNQWQQQANTLKAQRLQDDFDQKQKLQSDALQQKKSAAIGEAKLYQYLDQTGIPAETTDKLGNPTGKPHPYIAAVAARMGNDPQQPNESDQDYFDRLGVSNYVANNLTKQAQAVVTNPKATPADKLKAAQTQAQAASINARLRSKTLGSAASSGNTFQQD